MSNRTPRRSRPPAYTAPALEKGLDILELLAEQGLGLTQKQVATHLGRSPAEIFRMLAVLQRRGYVRRAASAETYHLTPRLFELAHRHPPTSAMLDAALPRMRALARRIGQSCHLAVRDDEYVVMIGQCDSPGFRGFSVRVGARLPWSDTTSGLLLLTFAPPDLSDELLSRIPSRARVMIRKQMARVRRAGVIVRKSSTIKGIVDVSAPICDWRGFAMAALTIPSLVPVNRPFNPQSFVAPLRTAAAAITAAVGGVSPHANTAPAPRHR